ncbi:UNVERIFIED_ORG: hypothetical protein ABID33_002182 [Xanthobacter viscosus]
MTKQLAIAAGDHGAGTAQQAHDGVARRRGLPFVAGEPAGVEDDLGDLLLGRTIMVAIGGLQHAAGARQLLRRQAGVRRHLATMQGGEEPANGFEAIEAVGAERHDGRKRPTRRGVGRKDEVEALAVGQVAQMVKPVIGADKIRAGQQREHVAGGTEGWRREGEDDAAGIFLWKPEDVRVGCPMRGIDREIAVPTFALHLPSALEQDVRPD